MVHKSTTEADQGSILLYYFCSRNHSRMTLNYTDKYSCTSRKATATKLMIKKLFTIETHWWLYRLQNIESPQFRSTGIDMILQKIEATSQERSRGVLMHLFIEPINQDTHTQKVFYDAFFHLQSTVRSVKPSIRYGPDHCQVMSTSERWAVTLPTPRLPFTASPFSALVSWGGCNETAYCARQNCTLPLTLPQCASVLVYECVFVFLSARQCAPTFPSLQSTKRLFVALQKPHRPPVLKAELVSVCDYALYA